LFRGNLDAGVGTVLAEDLTIGLCNHTMPT
jgi:hypothetical protein